MGLELGADDYLTKLNVRVRRLTSPSGEVVALTNNEFNLRVRRNRSSFEPSAARATFSRPW